MVLAGVVCGIDEWLVGNRQQSTMNISTMLFQKQVAPESHLWITSSTVIDVIGKSA